MCIVVYDYVGMLNISAVLGACKTVGAGNAIVHVLVGMYLITIYYQLVAIYKAEDTECKYLSFDPVRVITSSQG